MTHSLVYLPLFHTLYNTNTNKITTPISKHTGIANFNSDPISRYTRGGEVEKVRQGTGAACQILRRSEYYIVLRAFEYIAGMMREACMKAV